MSSKSWGIACVIAFLLVTIMTLAFPSLPPAQALYELLRFQPTSATVFGIPFTNVLHGVTNGFLWILVIATLYGFVSLISKEDPLPPLPEAPYFIPAPPEPLLVDQYRGSIPPSITVKIPTLDYDLGMIEGISSLRGTLLKNSGIQTVDDLLTMGSTVQGRHRLAKKIGVSEETLLKWIGRGDLLRVRGIGKQFSELLESAGVGSVTNLSKRNPAQLHQTLKVVNREKRFVKRIPPVSTLMIWVDCAKNLERLIE